MAAGTTRGDLLYVSDPGYGAVFVYTYSPFGMKLVGMLTGTSAPGAMCVDKLQNVWVLSYPGTGSYAALEYAHGGTQPVAMLIDPAGYPTGCAVDQISGNLAISSGAQAGEQPTIAVFKKARGKPGLFTDPSIPGFYNCCAYDNKGNLFGNGTVDQNQNLILVELPKGSSTFKSIPMHRDFLRVGGIQWDGQYLTVGDKYDGLIIRYEITANGGKEVGSTALNGVTALDQYFIDGGRVVAPSDDYANPPGAFVGIFRYPAGGQRIRNRPFSAPYAVVVSRAPRSAISALRTRSGCIAKRGFVPSNVHRQAVNPTTR